MVSNMNSQQKELLFREAIKQYLNAKGLYTDYATGFSFNGKEGVLSVFDEVPDFMPFRKELGGNPPNKKKPIMIARFSESGEVVIEETMLAGKYLTKM